MKELIATAALMAALAFPASAGPLSDAYGGNGKGASEEETTQSDMFNGTLREKVDGWREAAAETGDETPRKLVEIFAAHE